jgi:hypothetical protein
MWKNTSGIDLYFSFSNRAAFLFLSLFCILNNVTGTIRSLSAISCMDPNGETEQKTR